MKFYEVQKALEDGKKIKSKKYGAFFLKDECLYSEHDSLIEFIHGFAIYVILAEDWEIVEDIPEVKIEYKPYFRCPSCDLDNSNFAYYKAGWTCKKCGQVVKLIEPLNKNKSLDEFRYWLENLIRNSSGISNNERPYLLMCLEKLTEIQCRNNRE